MTYAEGLKIRKRMCESYPNCDGCPYNKFLDTKNITCISAELQSPEESEVILEKWDKEHPQKTIMDDFFEKYPNAPKEEDGSPCTCMKNLGYAPKETICIMNCRTCWSQPLEETDA